ncbi:MAG: hypothetical protein RIR25_370 [Verrucomicrobiota bacterium]|jgi:hypothetical protein
MRWVPRVCWTGYGAVVAQRANDARFPSGCFSGRAKEPTWRKTFGLAAKLSRNRGQPDLGRPDAQIACSQEETTNVAITSKRQVKLGCYALDGKNEIAARRRR